MYAEKLGQVADELAQADPLLGSSRNGFSTLTTKAVSLY